MHIAAIGALAFGKKIMINIVRDWMKAKKKNASNVTLSTYSDGTQAQKDKWADTYMNVIVS